MSLALSYSSKIAKPYFCTAHSALRVLYSPVAKTDRSRPYRVHSRATEGSIDMGVQQYYSVRRWIRSEACLFFLSRVRNRRVPFLEPNSVVGMLD